MKYFTIPAFIFACFICTTFAADKTTSPPVNSFLLDNFYASLGESLKHPKKSMFVGSKKDGVEFTSIPSEEAVLVGFTAKMGDWFGSPIVSAIQPIFEGRKGRFKGKVFGRPTTDLPIIVEAKPGFAVSEITVSAPQHHVHGFKITFREIDLINKSLSSKNSYDSDWVGIQPDDKSKTTGNKVHPAIGVFGRAGDWIAGLGLLY
jgi:hypothetical protein